VGGASTLNGASTMNSSLKVNGNFTVASGVGVGGIPIIQIVSQSFSFDSDGPCQTKTATITFTRPISSVTVVLSSWELHYDISHTEVKKAAVKPSVSYTAGAYTCSVSVYCEWEDTNYDDDWSGTVICAVFGVLTQSL